METVVAILGFGLVLSFLVLIHELGHYLAALWAGVQVSEFGLGYPPKLLTLFKRGTTAFTLNAIPLGGFVKMVGEDSGEKVAETSLEPGKKSFEDVSVWKQLVIICAGVTINLIFGVLVFIFVFSQLGIPQEVVAPRIGLIQEGSPAARSNVPEGVEIRGFKSDAAASMVPTQTVNQVTEYIAQHQGSSAIIVVSSSCRSADTCPGPDAEYSVYFRTAAEKPEDQGSLGIGFDQVWYTFYPYPRMMIESARHGVKQALFLVVMINDALAQMVQDLFQHNRAPEHLAGPVGIVHQAQQHQIFQASWLNILSFMGMLSINLGVMNLLPISPLDGGRALFIVLTELFGKRRVQKIDEYVTFAGYLLLLTLILSITVRDIYRLF